MKKMIVLLALLMLAVPAMAAVNIVVTDNTNGTATISYTTVGEANVPRAFALEVSVDAGNIVDVTPAIEGESTAAAKGFGIFPGTVDVNDADNVIDDFGTPVASSLDPDAPGQKGSDSVVLEMGSLYVDDVNAPDASGVLCVVEVSEAANLCVSVNELRGGIILEAGKGTEDAVDPLATNMDSAAVCAAVTFAPAVCVGDVDGDSWISPYDLGALVSFLEGYSASYYWVDASANPAADIDGDGWVSPYDLGALVSYLEGYAAQYYWTQDCITN